jgi:hypothetical protein
MPAWAFWGAVAFIIVIGNLIGRTRKSHRPGTKRQLPPEDTPAATKRPRPEGPLACQLDYNLGGDMHWRGPGQVWIDAGGLRFELPGRVMRPGLQGSVAWASMLGLSGRPGRVAVLRWETPGQLGEQLAARFATTETTRRFWENVTKYDAGSRRHRELAVHSRSAGPCAASTSAGTLSLRAILMSWPSRHAPEQ